MTAEAAQQQHASQPLLDSPAAAVRVSEARPAAASQNDNHEAVQMWSTRFSLIGEDDSDDGSTDTCKVSLLLLLLLQEPFTIHDRLRCWLPSCRLSSPSPPKTASTRPWKKSNPVLELPRHNVISIDVTGKFTSESMAESTTMVTTWCTPSVGVADDRAARRRSLSLSQRSRRDFHCQVCATDRIWNKFFFMFLTQIALHEGEHEGIKNSICYRACSVAGIQVEFKQFGPLKMSDDEFSVRSERPHAHFRL